ncbi:unnamed protein product [Mycena citricolor]|uniref:NAD(P)-binding protein n=1 Tax=Mycena citricolor TaxID=2018698 RepID=A0AAD2HVI0_9AGAR|nr:unnamed protein product [Mycena citricolor]CAK5282061.1 unnamed protein product [Mycena citricolor]
MANTTQSYVVTGANQGLGYHTVHQIAQKPHTLVFLGARRISAAQEAIASFASDIHPTSAVIPVYMDLTNDKTVTDAGVFVAAALKERGLSGLDALVNNAGIASGTDLLILTTNIAGTIAVKNTFRPMLKRGSRIVNVSSMLGSQALNEARPRIPVSIYKTYAASKAALNNLTLQWAFEEEESQSGIRVMALCPGLTATAANAYIEHGSPPSESCKIIVDSAVGTPENGVFLDVNGAVIPW